MTPDTCIDQLLAFLADDEARLLSRKRELEAQIIEMGLDLPEAVGPGRGQPNARTGPVTKVPLRRLGQML